MNALDRRYLYPLQHISNSIITKPKNVLQL